MSPSSSPNDAGPAPQTRGTRFGHPQCSYRWHARSVRRCHGLIGLLLFGTQIILYSLEVAVVRVQPLWPRSLVQPPLTTADIALLKVMAKQEERRVEEHITTTFDEE